MWYQESICPLWKVYARNGIQNNTCLGALEWIPFQPQTRGLNKQAINPIILRILNAQGKGQLPKWIAMTCFKAWLNKGHKGGYSGKATSPIMSFPSFGQAPKLGGLPWDSEYWYGGITLHAPAGSTWCRAPTACNLLQKKLVGQIKWPIQTL